MRAILEGAGRLRTEHVPALAIVLAVGGTVGAYVMVGSPPIVGAEDANIFFRYARNLAEGHGVVFNPGGERVEGITSLLWLCIQATVYATVGAASFEVVLTLISILLTAVVLGAVMYVLVDIAHRGPGLWLGMSWLVAMAGLYLWAGLSLMDVGLWAACIGSYVLALFRWMEGQPVRQWVLPSLVVALSVTRPDALLVVPGIAVVVVLVYGLNRLSIRAVAHIGVTLVATTALLVGARLAYFGYPLPNTYYTKVSPDLAYRLSFGLGYLLDYFIEHPLSILPASVALGALAVSVLATARRGFSSPTETGSDGVARRAAALFGGAVCVGAVSVVVVGGDHFQGHRFLQAYLPLLAVPMAVTAARLVGRPATGTALARVVGALAILLAVLFPVVEWTTVRRHAAGQALFSMALQGRAMGAAVAEPFGSGPYPELGVWMAGGIGYEYPGPVKDLLGLNWVAMGHSPGNRTGIRNHAAFNEDVFWSAPPDLMLPEPEALILRSGCIRIVMGGVLKGLLVTERFRAEFEPVRVRSEIFEPLVLYANSNWVPAAPSAVEPLGWSYCDDPRTGGPK